MAGTTTMTGNAGRTLIVLPDLAPCEIDVWSAAHVDQLMLTWMEEYFSLTHTEDLVVDLNLKSLLHNTSKYSDKIEIKMVLGCVVVVNKAWGLLSTSIHNEPIDTIGVQITCHMTYCMPYDTLFISFVWATTFILI